MRQSGDINMENLKIDIITSAKLNKVANCLMLLKNKNNWREIDKKDENWNTALHYACINKNKTIAYALCQAGACPVIVNKYNTTPSDYPFFKNDSYVT